MPVSPTGRRVDSVSPGGRKVDPRPYYQWLFDRRRSGELSPLASHFPPQPWPPSPSMVRTASAPADLHMGQPSPTGVGSVLLSPLSDAASFLAKAADLSLKRKDVGHALHCCNQAVSLGPDCGPAWRHRACARLQAGQAEAAVEDASAAVLAEPLNVHSWETRTAAKFGSGDYDGAVEDAAHAISLDAWRPSLWRRRALASVMLQEYGNAKEDLDKALHLDPKHAASWRNRGAVRLAMSDVPGAESDASRAVKLHPTVDSYLQRAKIRLEAGQNAEAIRDCTAALRRDRREADAWYLRALARSQTDPAGAVSDLSQAISRDPQEAEAWKLRAEIQLRRGKYEEVVEDSSEAMRLNGASAEILCLRGQAQYRRGAYQSAAADFEDALQYDPASETAAKLLERTKESLKKLEAWQLPALAGGLHSFIESVHTAQLLLKDSSDRKSVV